MDAKLKDWVVKKHEKLDPESKNNFLQTLKFAPEQELDVISSCIDAWEMDAVIETGEMVTGHSGDPPELLKALQEHFAGDMAAIAR